jgi:hypothetical protein
MSRIPNVTVSMEIDSFGNPSKIGFDKVALSMWGEDAIRAVSEWRFRPGKRGDAAIAVPCVMELAWFAPQQ